jgi:hypothetical protein
MMVGFQNLFKWLLRQQRRFSIWASGVALHRGFN